MKNVTTLILIIFLQTFIVKGQDTIYTYLDSKWEKASKKDYTYFRKTIKGKNNEERFNRLLEFFRKLANNPDLGVNEDVFQSEKNTGDRNRAMGYFMKDLGSIKGSVEEVLDLYFRQCSIEVTCLDIANIGAFFANHGRDLKTGEQLVPVRYMHIVKTVMTTCGMYDASGEFAVNVGVPAKSGVGGGIMCAVPNRMGIGTFGPALDKKGNSIAGLNVLNELAKELQLSIF